MSFREVFSRFSAVKIVFCLLVFTKNLADLCYSRLMKKLMAIPGKMFASLRQYLTDQERRLKMRKKSLTAEDPFADPGRLNENAAVDVDAAEQFGHARVSALKEETDKMLIRIRKALTKMRVGRYGLCERCGSMIETERLLIDPSAQFCVSCQKKVALPTEES